MTTTSTANVWRQVRSRILTYQPPTGTTLQARLVGRLYHVQAPDDAPWPHAIGVLRLRTDGAYNGDRKEGELEVTLYDRPRSRAEALEDMADVVDQAMLRYADGSNGLVFSREGRRDTLPAFLAPADREVCAIRLVYQLVVWPVYLTQHASS
jgi:hypothetical protein